MSRLIAFGCSLTFGHGLPDCHIPPRDPGYTPSKYSWPAVLSSLLDRECINLANPGSSNKRIWKTIIDFDYTPSDIVFILWSYPERSAILNKNDIQDIGPWMEDTVSKHYYESGYSKHDALVQSQLFISHANGFFKEKNITVYNLIVKKSFNHVFTLGGNTITHVPLYMCDDFRYYYPKALDIHHPGDECHRVFAESILTYITTGKINKLSILEKVKRKFLKV